MNKTNCLEWNICIENIENDPYYMYDDGTPNLYCEDCDNYKPCQQVIK